MNTTVNYGLRGLCLWVYASAIGKWAGWLPAGMGDLAPWIALALLAAHLIEVPLVWKTLKLHKGSLAASVMLTLLFGLLHWRPLAKAAAKP